MFGDGAKMWIIVSYLLSNDIYGKGKMNINNEEKY